MNKYIQNCVLGIRWIKAFVGFSIMLIILFRGHASAQHINKWIGRVSCNGKYESYLLPHDIFRNGQMTIPKSLVKSDPAYYFTQFLFRDTVAVTGNFTFECRLKNVKEENGIDAYDIILKLLTSAGSSGCAVLGNKLAQKYTSAFSGDDIVTNKPQLVLDMKEWMVLRLEYRDKVLHYLKDGKEFFALPYHENICNVTGFFFSFKGSGVVDWVRLIDASGDEIYKEDFANPDNIVQFSEHDPAPLKVELEYLPPECRNNTLQLVAKANRSATSFRWIGPNSFSSNEKSPVITHPGILDTGLYKVVVKVNECLAEVTTNMNVSFNIPFSKQVVIDSTICNGSRVHGYSKSGTYTDLFATSTGCDSIRILRLKVLEPVATGLPKQLSICPGDSIMLKLSNRFESYKWKDRSTQLSLSVHNPGKYWVTVLNKDGCSGSDTVWVNDDGVCSDIFIPNAFTPNNDGINDVWRIKDVMPAKLAVYNRFGQLVHSQDGMSITWDGSFKGTALPAGTYYYIYSRKLNDNWRKQTGSVTILR